MKKVLVVLSLMLFVGSLSTSVYAAMSTDKVELHQDDKKKKKKAAACCSEKDAKTCTVEEKKSCDKAQKEGAKACCSKSASTEKK